MFGYLNPCLGQDIGGKKVANVGTKIEIVGVEKEIKANILGHLSVENNILPTSALGFPRADAYIERYVRRALQALGYYQPKITLTGDHDNKTVQIDVGQPTRWQNVGS